MSEIVVVGTGMMGPGIAACLALAGNRVCVYGRSVESLERGLAAARADIELLQREGLTDSDGEVHGTNDLSSALSNAEFVFESIVEDLGEKQRLFGEVERSAPSTAIFASNTSGLPISRIADALEHPERAATTHFWNPAHLMPLVEIVKAEQTSDQTVAKLRHLLDAAGKQTVVVLKDVPGQLGNRLQHALYREAFHIVHNGIATVEDVDRAIRYGFGLRFPAYGLMEHADMVGLDMMLAIDGYLFSALCSDDKPLALLEEHAARGEMGVRSGRGLYDWSAKSAADVRARRDQFIIDRLKDRPARESPRDRVQPEPPR
jgi:3-hydroxybutyryl-CoA dehydrogenase